MEEIDEHHCPGTRDSSLINGTSFKLNPILIEELMEWRRVQNPYSTFSISTELEHGAGSAAFSDPLRVATENFTIALIRERMPGALKVPVLFTGPPTLQPTSADSGSFGRVCAVRLPLQNEFSCVVAEDNNALQETTWTVSKVAVKQILYYGNLPEYRQCARVVREARIWNRMRHKNIVPLLGIWMDFSSESPFPAFVSPWFNEGNLKTFLDRKKAITALHRLSFTSDIISALSYMHNHEFRAVHGDLRANNVLVRDSSAYLVDFGISRIDDETRGFSTQPMDQNPRYIAPERIFNSSADDDALKPTTQSDIFEYGSVFLEIWTGNVPWHEERANANIYMKRFRFETPPRPSDMGDEIWSFLDHCWAKDTQARPTAIECAVAVTKFKAAYALHPGNLNTSVEL